MKQINLKLTDEQFDKLAAVCEEKRISKQEFGIRAYKIAFLLLKGNYSVINNKTGNKVDII